LGYHNHYGGYKLALLKFITTNELARKIFGKRELVIIKKQLLGVSLTQSEKNRLSRDIRTKLDFVSKLSRFESEFKLKKGAEIKRIIEDSTQIISADPLFAKITAVVLYGSAVNNQLTLNSDIDISIKFDKINLKDATLFRKRISGKVNQKVDIQVFNVLPKKVQKEISKGKTIYSK